MYEGRYVYCIIPGGETRSYGGIGIGNRGDEVYTVNYRDLSAVVSATPVVEYEPCEENVLAHEGVVEELLKETTVLPLKFSTVFSSEEQLKAALWRLYPQLKSELSRLEGKVEVGVKAFWEPEFAMKEIQESNSEVARLQRRITETPGGLTATHRLRAELNMLVSRILNERAEEYSAEIFNAFKAHAENARLNKPVGHMVLNGAFLVGRDKVVGFSEVFRSVQGMYEGRGLKLTISGPWPPYNFVTLRYE